MTHFGHHIFAAGIGALATALVVLGSAAAVADLPVPTPAGCITQTQPKQDSAWSQFSRQTLTGEPGLSPLVLATVIASAPAALLLLTLARPCSPPDRRG